MSIFTGALRIGSYLKICVRRRKIKKKITISIFIAGGVTLIIAGALFFLFFKPSFQTFSFKNKQQLESKSILSDYNDTFNIIDNTKDQQDDLKEEPVNNTDEKPTSSVAILIDDLGWNLEIAKLFLTLEAPLSFAVLPNRPHSTKIAQEANKINREVLLHQPMEPHGYPAIKPGKDVLLHTMTKEHIFTLLNTNFNSIPFAVGINNHMGSLFTENEYVMGIVASYIKQKNIFFVDSLTTPRSVAFRIAKRYGVRSAKRNIFLDNREDIDYITGQLKKLFTLAKTEGRAIGIGHPHKSTFLALQKMLPEFKNQQVKIVPISKLVE